MISLRRATMDDAELLLSWRNDPETIALSNTPHPIPLAEHMAWLYNKLINDNCQLFIAYTYDPATDRDLEPIGMVRFDKKNGKTEIGIAIDRNHRNNGMAKKIISTATWRIHGPIVAKIKPCNLASVNAFKACHFQNFGVSSRDGLLRMEFVR